MYRNASKYKHMKGSLAKREEWYPDITPGAASELSPLAASASLIAVSWAATGGGSVGVIPVSLKGKRPTSAPLTVIRAHTAQVTDLAFSPFSDTLLASGSEDCSIRLWNIGLDGQKVDESSISAPVASLRGHKKRVDMIKFHPSAENVVASGSFDKSVRLWDSTVETEKSSFEFADAIFSLDWNYNGSLIALTARDKKIRVFDPRANSITQEGGSHEGVKPSYVSWLGDADRLVSTGFTKMRQREIAFWDVRDLSKPLKRETLDSSTGVLVPLFDNDAKLLFLAGKGDSNITVYEISDSSPYYTLQSTVTSSNSQKGIAMSPKRGLNIMDCEVDRLYKLCDNDIIPVTFEVPRKSHRTFADDLFPNTPGTQPALSATEWFSGETRSPLLQSLDPSRGSAPITPSSSSSATTTTTTTAPTSSRPVYTPETSDGPYRKGDVIKEAAKIKPEEDENNYYVPETVSIVRSSKFRHLTVAPWQQNTWFTNLKVGNMGSDSQPLVANEKYFAVPWTGSGGQVAVIPLSAPGKMKDHVGTVETGNEVTATGFHPTQTDLLFVGLDSALVKGYRVPEGLHARAKGQGNHGDVEVTLKGHKRRLASISFHPLAADVLVSTAMDLSIRLWDINTAEEKLALSEGGEHTDTIMSVVFNYDGSLLASSCKDKRVRLWDPRQNKVVNEAQTHQAPKLSRLAWLGPGYNFISSGFSKSSEREMIIFDTRNLSKPLYAEPVGVGSGVYEPFYDEDISVLSLIAMGDSSIKFYEISQGSPFVHFLTQHQSTTQQAGIARLPKSASVNVRNAELAQYVKLSGSSLERFAVKVPRTRLEFFQDDIYPSCRSHEPVMSANEWFAGKNGTPKLVDLQPSDMEKLSNAPKIVRKVRKFESITVEEDAADLKERVVNRFHDKMVEFKDTKEPLPQDLVEGADEDEWSD